MRNEENEKDAQPISHSLILSFPKFQKVAASIIGILMVSGIAFAAIHLWSLTPSPSPKGEGSEYTSAIDTARHTDSLSSQIDPGDETTVVRYEEATLEQILTDIADYYGLTLHWKNEEAKALRLFYIWNKQQPAAKTIESVNMFERIHLELSDSILTADIQTNSPKK